MSQFLRHSSRSWRDVTRIETLGHPVLYRFPDLDLEDSVVLEQISAMRDELAEHLRVPRRWTRRLRRTAIAAAIRESHSTEGSHVELDDAGAALEDEEPLRADQRTYAEIRGYRQALVSRHGQDVA